MIIETSAIVAILNGEPEASRFISAILGTSDRHVSTASYVELVNVVDRRMGSAGLALVDEFFEAMQIELVSFSSDQAEWARHARVTYGAGRHRADLNFGDCFSYGLARQTGEPLLFKGNDFAQTDLKSAV